MATIDRTCILSIWVVTAVAFIWTCVGLYWVGLPGDEGLWLDVTTAFAVSWMILVVWAICKDDRRGYRR